MTLPRSRTRTKSLKSREASRSLRAMEKTTFCILTVQRIGRRCSRVWRWCSANEWTSRSGNPGKEWDNGHCRGIHGDTGLFYHHAFSYTSPRSPHKSHRQHGATMDKTSNSGTALHSMNKPDSLTIIAAGADFDCSWSLTDLYRFHLLGQNLDHRLPSLFCPVLELSFSVHARGSSMLSPSRLATFRVVQVVSSVTKMPCWLCVVVVLSED